MVENTTKKLIPYIKETETCQAITKCEVYLKELYVAFGDSKRNDIVDEDVREAEIANAELHVKWKGIHLLSTQEIVSYLQTKFNINVKEMISNSENERSPFNLSVSVSVDQDTVVGTGTGSGVMSSETGPKGSRRGKGGKDKDKDKDKDRSKKVVEEKETTEPAGDRCAGTLQYITEVQ